MKSILLTALILNFGLVGMAQSDSVIVGKWNVCFQMDLDSNENCTTNNYVTYDFHEDGTYSDSREYIIMGKKHKYHGKWRFDGSTLIIDSADENGMKIPPQKHKINWLNETLFYSEGKEGRSGPTVYTYFKKE